MTLLPLVSTHLHAGVALLGLAAIIERRSNDDAKGNGGLKSMFEHFE